MPAEVATTSPQISPEAEQVLRELRKKHEPDVLLVVHHPPETQVYRLADGASATVGRNKNLEVSVADPALSRQHARFTSAGGVVTVEDLDSSHGTRLNGDRVQKAVVGLGDEVQLGSVTVVIHSLVPKVAARTEASSHDAFIAALDDEVERAKVFHRTAAVVVIAGASPLEAALKAVLRPVDRFAHYGDGTLELLFAEMSGDEARRVLAPICEGKKARVGVAVYPTDGSTAESLIEWARGAMRRATGKTGQTAAVSRDRDLVFVSPAMKTVHQTLLKVARSSLPVLLNGETGTGKEVLARLLHEKSGRAKGPFVAINCGAIPETLVESVLFGHQKGAFTGAHADAEGVFEQAKGGTLLLDEVGELPAATQAALLRVLESKEVRRVGGKETLYVDVRVLAATHRDLDAMTKAGTFRQDLLYRLNTMTVDVPALRERPDEIGPLVAKFLASANALNERKVEGLDSEAMRLMLRYGWPGNIRELRNAVEHAVVVATGPRVTAADLPLKVRNFVSAVLQLPATEGAVETSVSDLNATVARYETQVILEALRAAGGNRTEAARRLAIPIRTLSHKLKRYGIKKVDVTADSEPGTG